ncbi:acid stress response protein YqgB [Kosakonia oryzendophytica]|uniref:acid stress response protein YqgB n=1 Tax=Kosakonia oryzendophytica TaxID=1005665 RepID=UPI003D346326
MNKKPVAQPALQHDMLSIQAVYGLLSLCVTAIVVNCFVSVAFYLAALGRGESNRVYTFLR